MQRSKQPPKWLAAATAAAGLALVGGAVFGVYQAFFTPEKRAVRARLAEADDKSRAAVEAHLKPVRDLFDRGCSGAKGFAEDALSLNGKLWALAGLIDRRQHKDYLTDAFNYHVFTPRQLRAAVEASVTGYLLEVEKIEGEMLVKLRADLAGFGDVTLPHTGSDAAFAQEYRRLLAAVASEACTDLGVDVSRLVGTEVIAWVTTQAMTAVASEMGVSLTVFGSSSAASLGTGIVVSVVADYAIGLALEAAGYKPAEKIAAAVQASLRKTEAALIRRQEFHLMRDKWEFFVTEPTGALRARLEELHDARAKVRRDATALYLKGGGK